MEITTRVGDISETEGFDVIVNSSNYRLLPNSNSESVDGAIRRKAGKGIAEECRIIGSCPTGEAVITDAYALSCKRVIHTVGPMWHGDGTEEWLLESCYNRVLNLAQKEGLRKIAFPSISAGGNRYPEERAAQIAVETVQQYAKTNPQAFDEIAFVLYNDKTKNIYDKTIAKFAVREQSGLSLSLEIQSYDEKRLHHIIVSIAEEKLSRTNEILKKMLLKGVNAIPDLAPEKLLMFVTNNKLIRQFLFDSLNKYFAEEEYPIKIRNIVLQNQTENDGMQLLLELEDCNFTNLTDSICRKIRKNNQDKMVELLLSGVVIVNETIAEENKRELLKKLINGLQKELGDFVEDFVKEHYQMRVEIGDIKLSE